MPTTEYPSSEQARTEAAIARSYARMLGTVQFTVTEGGDEYTAADYIHNLDRFADTLEAAAARIEALAAPSSVHGFVIATRPGTEGAPTPNRTGTVERTLAAIIETVDGYVEDGYSVADLVIEGVTE